MTVKRVWRGWTSRDGADAYEHVLLTQVIPGIEAMGISGFRGIEVLREDQGDEVEFSTVMTFDRIDDVVAFQGPDYARAYVPESARAVLTRWDETSRHYEVREVRRYD